MQVTEADLEHYAGSSSLRLYAAAELAKVGNGNNQYTGGSGSGKDSEQQHVENRAANREAIRQMKLKEGSQVVHNGTVHNVRQITSTGQVRLQNAHTNAQHVVEGRHLYDALHGVVSEVMHAGTEIGGKITGPLLHHGGE